MNAMALAGELSEFPLTDIIQLVDLSKKTGGVQIRGRRGAQQLEGWLYFRDGKIIAAELADLAPLEAALTFFTLASGPFQFHEGTQPASQTITQSNEVIIMEGIMRQEQWAEIQDTAPALNMIPRLVPNPASTGSEISLEAEEWRVLTMVNGKNTVAQIAQRSGLGEVRTTEIVTRLLANGLIEKREASLAETLFPDLERVVMTALGAPARALLYDAYGRAGIRDQNTATAEQVISAIDTFEALAARAFGLPRVRQVIDEMRSLTQHALSSA
jgi:DNA-binding MarR family transcriptional regulator